MEPTSQPQDNQTEITQSEPTKIAEEKTFITIDDYAKVEITAGEIISAEKMPNADKLLILKVNFGEEAPRQICSGIAAYYPDPQVLIGKKVAFCTNLAPRMLRGYESQGMILAASSGDAFSLLEIASSVPAGTKIK